MIKNYFKTAWRSLVKDLQFTSLNLIGLAIGLACALLIYLWVHDEVSVDKFHKNDSRLYQVLENVPLGDGGTMTTGHTPILLVKSLKEEIPEIEDGVSIKSPDEDENPKGIISATEASVKARELFVTGNFFDVFSYHLIEGDKRTVFSGINNVLLSDELAMKLFHSTRNIVGKTITWNRGTGPSGKTNGVYIVSGIFEAPSAKSSMKFDLLFGYDLYVEKNKEYVKWNNSTPETYVLLKEGIDIKNFNEKIRNFIRSKLKTVEGSVDDKWVSTLFAQRYSDIYLHNHYENGVTMGGRIEYVKLFSIIAMFILAIACINFMNLSTAKASKRLKEVGIKKVMGASRVVLIFQYLGESMLITFSALLIAIIIVTLLLPSFNSITGKNIVLQFDGNLIFSVSVITLITGFIAGSYPALYLSGFKPAVILKGKLQTSANESWLRKGLVVFQFAVSVILIVSVLVVYKQMALIQTKNLGYNKYNIIHFANEGKLPEKRQEFLSEMKDIPGVVNASVVEGDMLGNHSGGSGIDWPGKSGELEFGGLYVDYDFMETMGLQMKEGRMFSRKFGTDSNGVIFNETAIAAMKLTNPIGETVNLWGMKAHIIGVVKDFHFESMYKKIGPFFLGFTFEKNPPKVIARLKAGMEKQTLSRLEKLYKAYNPGLQFEYNFLDNDYQALYFSERRVAVLSRYFAAIAILISCLGLFGLSAFTAQKRQKEIGIRKAIGASVTNVAAMLSTDFLKLLLIALFIALPFSWWATHQWLQSFAYRINITVGIFLITSVSVFFITLLTISFQTIKAAIANPVKSLRTD